MSDLWSWGATSLRRLDGVSYDLLSVLDEARRNGCPELTIPRDGGLRTVNRQAVIVGRGDSWTMHSKHLSGRAVDVAPYPTDWDDRDAFAVAAAYILGSAMRLNVKLEWGGLWQVRDMGHFELRPPS